MFAERRILIVEDDKSISNFLSISLRTSGYDIQVVTTGIEGIGQVMNDPPDLVLLDLGLPDLDGLEVLHQMRSFSQVPVIVVSARTQEREKVQALDGGANDYVTKPFSIGELLARVRVALRTPPAALPQEEVFSTGDLTVDFGRRQVRVNGEEVHLTPIEYKRLLLLIEHRGKVLTHSFILKEIWGYSGTEDSQSLRVFMANIRRKIETDTAHPHYILTEVGVGYRFVDE